MLGQGRAHIFDLFCDLFALLISRRVCLIFSNRRLRLTDLRVKTSELCFVLRNLLVIEFLLYGCRLDRIGIGLLREREWMVIQLRFIARYLRTQTSDLLLKLLDVCSRKSGVERRQDLPRGNFITLADIDAFYD